jgi:hypothetical protein
VAKIERFEEIVGWQKGRELCKMVYAITDKEPSLTINLQLHCKETTQYGTLT